MAPDAVDDRYIHCSDKAFDKFIKAGLLKEELNRSAEFSKAWNTGAECSTVIAGKSKEHLTALRVQTSEDSMVVRNFNQAVKTLGADAQKYKDQFHFKSIHFLLMDSMKKVQPKDCKTVYAVSLDKYNATKGSKVRLGRFLKAYSTFSDLKKSTDLEGLFIFNITSCFFANLKVDKCNNDDAVLLSPAEGFTVEDLVSVENKDDDVEYQMLTLKHAELVSFHNCYIFSR